MKKLVCLVILMVVLLLGLLVSWEEVIGARSDTSPASDPQELPVAGHYGGVTRAVFWNNDTTYVGIGPSLHIFDATGTTTPTLLGKTLPLPGVIRDISVISSTAYVAVGSGGLSVVDVSDPTAPGKIAEYFLEEGRTNELPTQKSRKAAPLAPQYCYDPGNVVYQIHGKGTRIYVAYGLMGLRILDMSDPSNPVEYGSLDSYDYLETMAVYTKGRYAYIVDVDYEYNYSYFRVVDVSNPSQPTAIGLKALGHVTARDVYVDGDFAYVATGTDLTIVDVKDPVNPIIVAKFGTPGSATQVVVRMGLAFVADYHRGLQIINASDPTKPVGIGSYDQENRIQDIHILDETAYAADIYAGLIHLDVSDPSQPEKIGSYSVPGTYKSVAVDDGYAYLAHGGQGMGILDISIPAQISELARFRSEDHFIVDDIFVKAESMSMVGRRSSASEDVMMLVDKSNPSAPQERGEYSASDDIYDVNLAGDLAYVAAMDAGLRVVDISDPEIPKEIGHLDKSGPAAAVDVVSDTVYLADYDVGLRVIDASDPYNLEVSGIYSIPYSTATDVSVSGKRAYLAYLSDGLKVVDVSDPTNPVEIGAYQPEMKGWPEIELVQASGDLVYFVEEVINGCDYHLMYSTIRVFDFSDPGSPQELGYFQFPDNVTDLYVENGWIYATYSGAGLMIIRYTDPAVYPHQVYLPHLMKIRK